MSRKNQLNVLTILELLGVVKSQPKSNNVTITCPHCGKPKFNINLSKGLFNCPACVHTFNTGGANPVALYALLKDGRDTKSLSKKDRGEYYAEIMSLLGKGGGNVVSKYIIPESKSSTTASVEVLDKVYRALADELELYDIHYNELVKRGLSPGTIEKLRYRTYPFENQEEIAQKLVDRGLDLEGVPGFYLDKSGKWTMKKYSGIILFIHNHKGMIIGAQIMNDFKGDFKYLWLTSADLEKGSSPGAPMHMVGLPEKEVFLTEGSLKATIANQLTGKTYLAVQGINALHQLDSTLDYLKNSGVKMINIAFDMDFKTNVHVQAGLNNVIKKIKAKNLMYQVVEWDPQYNGIDDFLWSKKLKSIKLNKEKLPFRLGETQKLPHYPPLMR